MTPEEIYHQHGEALVFMGAGGPAKDWMNGIADLLYVDGVTTEKDPAKIWKTHISLNVGPDRTDLVLPFTGALDIGRLALWRIIQHKIGRFGVMWLSDYIDTPQAREA